MIIRRDLKSKYGVEAKDMLSHTVEYIQIVVGDLKVIFDENCPPTYYVQDITGKWFLVSRKSVFQLLQIDKDYIVLTLNDIIIGLK